MKSVKAWLLDFGTGCRAAVGQRELLHLVDVQQSFPVPCTPAYCNRVLFWQEKLLPLMDVALRLGNPPASSAFIAVVGYQQRKGEYPQFGALQLAAPPAPIVVSDEQACKLPEELYVWQGLAISCFEHQGDAIPVLHLNRLFAPA